MLSTFHSERVVSIPGRCTGVWYFAFDTCSDVMRWAPCGNADLARRGFSRLSCLGTIVVRNRWQNSRIPHDHCHSFRKFSGNSTTLWLEGRFLLSYVLSRWRLYACNNTFRGLNPVHPEWDRKSMHPVGVLRNSCFLHDHWSWVVRYIY